MLKWAHKQYLESYAKYKKRHDAIHLHAQCGDYSTILDWH